MAIVVKLDDMLHARRMTLTELPSGSTSRSRISQSSRPARHAPCGSPTLDAICDVLQCQPGDLLEFAPSSAAEDASVADSPAASSAARLPLKRPLGSVPEEA
jgi:putative transcriptional regulator